MKTFLLTRLAERDLDQIKDYLVLKVGPRVASRVLKDLRSALQLLGREPRIGHTRDDLIDRSVLFWPVYSYMIDYDPAAKPIQVLRVLHGARDVEGILN
jgi:toxin ParE1/3/4